MHAPSIAAWRGKIVFVLGDIMLDKFVYGHVDRVSPEAPIPVLHHQNETRMLGGAANVARNVVALGGRAILSGAIGQDDAGKVIEDELTEGEGIEPYLVRTPLIPTTVKTRFVSAGQQIMRLDVEEKLRMNAALEKALCDAFVSVADRVDAVVLSDYGKGTLSVDLVKRIIKIARERLVSVIVDPKTADVSRYAGATILTPNAAEAALVTGVACKSDEAAAEAARSIADRAGVDAVIVTRGGDGMTVFAPSSACDPVHIATTASEVYDVSGAGDTVVATLALAVASGRSVPEAAEFANAAAGVSVGKRGTSVVFSHELRRAITLQGLSEDRKIMDVEDAAVIVADWRRSGLKVGFTNGCYDLIHPGHVQLLKQARGACDRLVVALNTDASIRRLKGESRPVQNETSRATVVASMLAVDLVMLFGEDTPLSLIERLKPDVLIKGADYTVETVVGANVVIENGGKVVLVPLEKGQSTTSIIARATSE
ncbi:D-glycero-beta-D-manno-heptose-7-phosphate kinase [Ensifer sp. 22564]|uniref:D-glycero-beta-D-manno-heptose-7-phosphate kinase n=1 Tax=Ensifer sp. 22564 TaxID=3453943 RepID=UPI003F83E78C